MISFNDVIGQDSIKEHFISAIRDGKVSHAYILSGEEGSGKMMLAERFAAALQCDSDSPDKPCGSCIACMQSESRNHPDIIYVTHEKSRILVDDIRNQLINDIQIKPYSGQYKVYIIDEAEKMNEAAQNALLKTLEEPPAYAVILLLASNTGAFLPTILSRCVTLQLKPVRTELVADYLIKNQHIPDYLASLCASFSGGCIGKAVKYASDEDFSELKDRTLKLVSAVRDMQQPEMLDFIDDLTQDKSHKASLPDFLDLLLLWYRDLLMYKSTNNMSRIFFSEDAALIRKQASAYSYYALNNIINTIDETRSRLDSNVSADLSLEMLLFAMKAD